MKNGISREDEGFDLLVDGRDRTSRDLRGTAHDAAREFKRLNRDSIIEIQRSINSRGQYREFAAVAGSIDSLLAG